jgi:hypothetical protein
MLTNRRTPMAARASNAEVAAGAPMPNPPMTPTRPPVPSKVCRSRKAVWRGPLGAP